MCYLLLLKSTATIAISIVGHVAVITKRTIPTITQRTAKTKIGIIGIFNTAEVISNQTTLIIGIQITSSCLLTPTTFLDTPANPRHVRIQAIPAIRARIISAATRATGRNGLIRSIDKFDTLHSVILTCISLQICTDQAICNHRRTGAYTGGTGVEFRT
jgi:hypothetical protein